MTITKAANELEAIRNNRTDSPECLMGKVDAIGQWLASQKHSAKVGKLLQECHQLHDRLNGGSGKGGNRIQIG